MDDVDDLKFNLKLDDFGFDDDNVDSLVIGPNDDLRELKNGKLIDKCDLYCRIDSRCRVRVLGFCSFDPFCEYYLLHCNTDYLIVVKRHPLEAVDSVKGVKSVDIDDFWDVGCSQVRIEFNNGLEPLVTTFSLRRCADDFVTVPVQVGDLLKDVLIQQQTLRVEVAKSRRVLEKKKQLKDGEGDDWAVILGPRVPVESHDVDSNEFSSPWTKDINGKIIIGLPFSANEELSEIKVFLDSHQILKWTTKVFSNENISLSSTPSGTVVISIEMPVFTAPELSLKITVSYRKASKKHAQTIPLTINTKDLIKGKLSISKSPSEIDLLAIKGLGTTSTWVVPNDFHLPAYLNLRNALQLSNSWLWPSNNGLLLEYSRPQLTITCDSPAQLSILVEDIKSQGTSLEMSTTQEDPGRVLAEYLDLLKGIQDLIGVPEVQKKQWSRLVWKVSDLENHAERLWRICDSNTKSA